MNGHEHVACHDLIERGDIPVQLVSAEHRIPSLDGLRAISIAMVVIGHASGTFAYGVRWAIPFAIAANGHTGVSIFFVISGFLITGLLLRQEEKRGSIALPEFYLRRAFRIFPALYLYLVTIGCLGAFGRIQLRWSDWWAAALFAWNYLGRENWFLGHTWSLSIEEQFYLIWPLIVALSSKRARILVALSIIVASPLFRVTSYFVFPATRPRIPIMGHTRADMLMFGCLLALLHNDERLGRLLAFLHRWRAHVAAAGFLFLVEPLLERRFAGAWLLPFGYSLEGICIALILVWAVEHPSESAAKLLNIGPVVFLGRISFSLYLWQQLFLTPLNSTRFGKFPLNVCCAIAIATASYFLVEQPMLRLRGQLFRRANGVSRV